MHLSDRWGATMCTFVATPSPRWKVRGFPRRSGGKAGTSPSDGIRRTRASRHPARVGQQKLLIERANVFFFWTRIAECIESTERSFVGNIAKNETQVASRYARGQQTLYRSSCVAEGAIGIALAILDDVVQCLIAQVYVDHFLPEMVEKLFSRCHVLLTPPC